MKKHKPAALVYEFKTMKWTHKAKLNHTCKDFIMTYRPLWLIISGLSSNILFAITDTNAKSETIQSMQCKHSRTKGQTGHYKYSQLYILLFNHDCLPRWTETFVLNNFVQPGQSIINLKILSSMKCVHLRYFPTPAVYLAAFLWRCVYKYWFDQLFRAGNWLWDKCL